MRERNELAELLPDRVRDWMADLDLEWLLKQELAGSYPYQSAQPSPDD